MTTPATDAGTPLLEVEGLRAAYGKAVVLDGVDFAVYPGETVAVVGPNGAGKTTLLRTLSRLMASQGAVTFDGAPLAASPYGVVKSGLVHCPERRRLFPGLTVRENLELGTHRLGRAAAANRSADLERVFTLFPRLSERQAQQAGTLSGGEQQQCAIGRALMARPTLLMLDEPTLGLSVGIKEAIVSSVQEIAASGTTMLLVEQDVTFALRCAERTVVLEHGRVTLSGPSAEIAAHPHVREVYLGVA